MDFSEIIGQKGVVNALKRSLEENRIGHAYIFTGPAGIGKKTIAHVFAGLLLCENPRDGATCGVCKPCVLFRNGTNPDYRRIGTDDSSIGVDAIRDMQEDVALKPIYSKRKVYIIEEADKLTEQAQNCLLKTFEEPPRYAVIILLSVNYESLLETIRSRAWHFRFGKYTKDQVRSALYRKLGGSGSLIELAADYSDGNIGLALELAGSGDFFMLREKVFSLLPGIANGKSEDILEFSAFMDENRERAGLVLDIMLLYFRDILVASETGDGNLLINSDKKDIILSNAPMYRGRRAADSIEAVEAARWALKYNANYQLTMDNMLMKLREV